MTTNEEAYPMHILVFEDSAVARLGPLAQTRRHFWVGRPGLYRLLFQVANQAELDSFVDQVLGDLIAYDSKHQADFVLTLDSFLRNNASPQATARELAVHVNTVSYRLQRIRTISGLIRDGVLASDVGETFPLDRIADAVRAAETPGKPGKVLLQIGS